MANVPPTVTLPVPDDVLACVFAQARADHPDTCDMDPVVSTVPGFDTPHLGQGRHVHDGDCPLNQFGKCHEACYDADYVITVQYARCGYLATYGVLVADGAVASALWAD